jgi:transcriptional regulator with XRE-family HTH domain
MPDSDQPPDPATTEWLALRERVQRRRAQRGLLNTEIAAEIGVAVTTLSTVLSIRRPPSHAMTQRLSEWVNRKPTSTPAPEVAVPAAPFHPDGNGYADGDSAGSRAS